MLNNNNNKENFITIGTKICPWTKEFLVKTSGQLKKKIQLDATYYFIMLMLGSTCFGHHYAHRQELVTIAVVTT